MGLFYRLIIYFIILSSLSLLFFGFPKIWTKKTNFLEEGILFESSKGISNRKNFSFPDLSGFIADSAEIIGFFEEGRISDVLNNIEKETPEKMRFIIYTRKTESDFITVDTFFVESLFQQWDLDETAAVLVVSVFELSRKSRYISFNLIKGTQVSHYFAEESTDLLIFELGRYFKQSQYRGAFLSTTSMLLKRVIYAKKHKIIETDLVGNNVSSHLSFWDKYNPFFLF